MRLSYLLKNENSIILYSLAVLVTIVFLTGGASRYDALSNAFLTPVSFIFLAIAAFLLKASDVQKHRVIAIFAFMTAGLVAIQLVPVPPGLWFALSAHRAFESVAQLTGTLDHWRPISLVPELTRLSLVSLAAPFAVLLLSIRCREDTAVLAWVLLGLGAISALLGIAQIVGPKGGPLYFYAITNEGSAVGLFANRNHHAAFLACLYPIIALLASEPQKDTQRILFRNWGLIGFGALIVPLVLVTGSRGGIAWATIGIASAFWIYKRPVARRVRGQDAKRKRFLVAGVILYAAVMTLVATVLARGESLERLIDGPASREARFAIWRVAFEQAVAYFPFGTGYGAFAEVFQIAEPDGLLGPYYYNHAHNDWLEIVHSGGIGALVLMIGLLLWWCSSLQKCLKSKQEQGRTVRIGKTGLAMILILGLASLFDYPLRTPSLLCLFVLAAVWVSSANQKSHKNNVFHTKSH